MAENNQEQRIRVFGSEFPLDQMGLEELCDEAVRVRNLMMENSERLNEIYATLYTMARRMANEASYQYISIANSGKRFSGMVYQAARRTAGVENRILTGVARDAEERDRQKQLEAQRLARREAENQKRASAGKDPLEVLYGIPKVTSEEVSLVSQDLSETTSSDIDDLYGEEPL